MDAAFYCVSDSRYFLGAVALLNSLRLAGHEEPVFLLDCGLAGEERELLAQYATLVPAPPEASPILLKSEAPLAHPAAAMVLIDADMVVTQSLGPLLDLATEGKVVAFADPIEGRFFPEWGELLDLGPLRRRTYLNSGLIALPGRGAAELLELTRSSGARVDMRRTGRAEPDVERPTPNYPFRFADQDIWNAVLAARTHAEDVVVLDRRLAPYPPFPGLRLLDEGTAECSYSDGVQPFVLHCGGRYKPWLHSMRSNLYSRLLPRLLIAQDLTIRLELDRLPLRLRPGLRGWLERRRSDLVDLARLPRGRLGVRRRLAARRAAQSP